MADKQLGVRVPEHVMVQLEQRVQQINELTPEASVTVSSVVRYAIQAYTEQLQRQQFEQHLTLPLANELTNVERMELLAYGIIDDEQELVTYDAKELATIEKGMALISSVLASKSNVSKRVKKEWQQAAMQVARVQPNDEQS